MKKLHGKHSSLDKDLTRSVDWLKVQAGVGRIILGPIAVCKHAFAPGTLRVHHVEPERGLMELKAYFEVGVRPLYVYHTKGMTVHLTGRIEERFYPRLRFTARPGHGLSVQDPVHASLRDQDFDSAMRANGYHWNGQERRGYVPALWAGEDRRAEPQVLEGHMEIPVHVEAEAATVQEREAPIPVKVETPAPPIQERVKRMAQSKMENITHVTVQGAAKRLKCSDSQIRMLIRKGKITGTIQTAGGVLVPVAALDGVKIQSWGGRRRKGQEPTVSVPAGMLSETTAQKLLRSVNQLVEVMTLMADQSTAPSKGAQVATPKTPGGGAD